MLFLDVFNFLVGDELQTYTYTLVGYTYTCCEHFVGWYKIKFVELTHLVDMLGLVVHFSPFLKFL